MIRFFCILLTAAISGAQPAGDLAATEKSLEELTRKQPTADLWQRLGLARHLQNRYETAIPAFREAIRLNPNLWTSHLFLGIGLYRTNQFPLALESLNRADRLAPRSHAGRDDLDYWLGATRIALKQPMAGLRSLEVLLARNPRHPDALELVTQTYADLGTSLWNQVAEKHFDTAPGREVHGHALEDEGNRAAAIVAYRESKAMNEKRAGPRLELARLLFQDEKAGEALALLKEESSISIDPQVSLFAGMAAMQTGSVDAAIPWLEESSRWSSSGADAALALAQIRLSRKETKAIDAARRAVQLAPDSQAAHELLLAALAQANDRNAIADEEKRWSAIQRR